MTFSSTTGDAFLRCVVYCDEKPSPVTLPDLALPRNVESIRRLIEDQLHLRPKLLSFWNYAKNRYEILRNVLDLLQPEARLPTTGSSPKRASPVRHHHRRRSTAGSLDGTISSSTASSADLRDTAGSHTERKTVFRVQLWVETVLLELEPLNPNRDAAEFDELRRHVRRWLGNQYVGYDIQDAVRIRCPFLTRMFDETRNSKLEGGQDKVQLLYYSNNAWSVRDVLQYGFLLNNGVPTSLNALLHGHGSQTDISTTTDTRLSIPVPETTAPTAKTGNARRSTPPSSLPVSPPEWPIVPPQGPLDTLANPFIFTSSMLSPNTKVSAADTTPHKVLLCEVAPGRRFVSDQGLTGHNRDRQSFPAAVLRTPPGYDSVCYMRAHVTAKDGSSGNRPLHTVDTTDVNPEDLALAQVQVSHSYQALPRYLLTVVPTGGPPPPRRQNSLDRSTLMTASPMRSPGTSVSISRQRDSVRTPRSSQTNRIQDRRANASPLHSNRSARREERYVQHEEEEEEDQYGAGSGEVFRGSSSGRLEHSGRRGSEERVSESDAGAGSRRGDGVRRSSAGSPNKRTEWLASTQTISQSRSFRGRGADDCDVMMTTPSRSRASSLPSSPPRNPAGVRTSVFPQPLTTPLRGPRDVRAPSSARSGLTSPMSASRVRFSSNSGARSGVLYSSDLHNGSRSNPSVRVDGPVTGTTSRVPSPSSDEREQGVRHSGDVLRGEREHREGGWNGRYNGGGGLRGMPQVYSAQPGVRRMSGAGGNSVDDAAAAVSGRPLIPSFDYSGGSAYAALPAQGGPPGMMPPSAMRNSTAFGPLNNQGTSDNVASTRPQQPPPAAFNQFLCGVHPRQLQSLYCTACDELTCSYCASIGAHRDHVVVEATEHLSVVHADAQQVHESLRHWLTQYTQTERELRVAQSSWAAKQQRELRTLQQNFQMLREALQQSEHSMSQAVLQRSSAPPLLEAAAVVNKYRRAIAPLDRALHRYHDAFDAGALVPNAYNNSNNNMSASAAAAMRSGNGGINVPANGNGGSARGGTRSLPEMLYFLRTAPTLLQQINDGFLQQKKEEERILQEGIDRFHSRTGAAATALYDHVDWVGLRTRLGHLGEMRDSPHRVLLPPGTHKTGSPLHFSPTSPALSAIMEADGSRTGSVVRQRTRNSLPPSPSLRLVHLPKLPTSISARAGSVHSPAAASNLSSVLAIATTPQEEDGGGMAVAKRERLLLRCLSDLQRGYIWAIQDASLYFTPGQRKAVCSTPFSLLGVKWELRIAPLPVSTMGSPRASRSGAVAIQPGPWSKGEMMLAPGLDAGVISAAADTTLRSAVANANSDPASRSPLATHILPSSSSTSGAAAAAERWRTATGEAEWLGLFLFPVDQTMRVDFRVIAFSEVTWAEWSVTGWTPGLAGKGWGLFPFLQRKELMRTDKLARDNVVKICVTPISDLY